MADTAQPGHTGTAQTAGSCRITLLIGMSILPDREKGCYQAEQKGLSASRALVNR